MSGSATLKYRVAILVSQGGHDVPTDKLVSRYPRGMENLRRAMVRLPLVLVYGNDDLREPHRFCVAAGMGKLLEVKEPVGTGCEYCCRKNDLRFARRNRAKA